MEGQIYSGRLYIRNLMLSDVIALLQLRLANRDFLRPFEPMLPDSHFTWEGQLDAVHTAMSAWEQGTGYSFGIFLAASDTLIGRVNLSNVVRGAWQNCTIGYFLDRGLNGRGYMTEAVQSALRFAFEKAGLHRVQAAVMPRNAGSIRVVTKNGFRHEGFAPRYLQINGKWEDHNLYAITAEDWQHFAETPPYSG